MSFRRFLAALWIALGLLLGQQAAALHDLAHAAEQFGQKPGVPTKHTCDQCFLAAQLSGAVGAHVSVPPVVLDNAVPALSAGDASVIAAPRRAFLSRAPPAVL